MSAADCCGGPEGQALPQVEHPADCCTAACREGRSYIELVAEGQQQDKLLWTSQGMKEWRTEDNLQEWIRLGNQGTGQLYSLLQRGAGGQVAALL